MLVFIDENFFIKFETVFEFQFSFWRDFNSPLGVVCSKPNKKNSLERTISKCKEVQYKGKITKKT